jgi:hypothetical protein
VSEAFACYLIHAVLTTSWPPLKLARGKSSGAPLERPALPCPSASYAVPGASAAMLTFLHDATVFHSPGTEPKGTDSL